ncbi:MAG: hypothetical protein NZ761_09050 [Dehalococcoidia bacterium]|nr:hypothetical protein [Dehalococcoidia bacterium]
MTVHPAEATTRDALPSSPEGRDTAPQGDDEPPADGLQGSDERAGDREDDWLARFHAFCAALERRPAGEDEERAGAGASDEPPRGQRADRGQRRGRAPAALPGSSAARSRTEQPPAPSGEHRGALPPARIAAIWNEVCARPDVGLAPVLGLTRQRTQKIAKRCQEIARMLGDDARVHDEDWWRAAFERVARSSFLCGANDANWTATFDWLMEGDRLLRLLEGQYDRNGRRWTDAARAGGTGTAADPLGGGAATYGGSSKYRGQVLPRPKYTVRRYSYDEAARRKLQKLYYERDGEQRPDAPDAAV